MTSPKQTKLRPLPPALVQVADRTATYHWYVAIVVDLDRDQRTVHLATQGFESCVVEKPGLRLRLAGALELFYQRPGRVDAASFVDELLAASLTPKFSTAEVRTLRADDRARLRRAVVAVFGCERDWRKLYGSHLSPDERVFAVMYWRRERQRARRAQLRHENVASLVGRVPLHVDGWVEAVSDAVVPASVADRVLRDFRPMTDFVGFGPPSIFTAIEDFKARMASTVELTDRFEVLPGVNDLIRGGLPAIELAKPEWTRTFGIANLDAGRFELPSASPFADLAAANEVAGRLTAGVGSGIAELLGATAAQVGAVRALEDSAAFAATFSASPWHQFGRTWALVEALQRAAHPSRELTDAMEALERFERRWQQEALYFLLAGFLAFCSVRELGELATLSRPEVEAVVLLALEEVVCDGVFIEGLRAELTRAPYLTDFQRINLDHALEHAAKREYTKACLPLYGGLEGAFWEVGYVQAVITLERKDARNPKKEVAFE